MLAGVFSLKFALTEYRLHYGGHIGYAVRCVCDDDNIAAEKTILKNGGRYENGLYNEAEALPSSGTGSRSRNRPGHTAMKEQIARRTRPPGGVLCFASIKAHDIAAEHLLAGDLCGVLGRQRLFWVDGLHVRGDGGQRLAEAHAVRAAV